jgi:membrane protease YdiL (CAAX protease family)
VSEFGLTSVLIGLLTSEAAGGLASRAGETFAWGMAATFLLVGAHSLRFFDRTPPEQREPLWLTADPGYPAAVSVLIGVGEEVLFRGYLQSTALPMMDPVYAVFGVNLVFAAVHIKGGLTFALSAGFFGMIASVMTLASGSLLPAIVMHGGWNLLMGFARKREAARMRMIEAHAEAAPP